MLSCYFTAFHDFLAAVILHRKSGSVCNYADFWRYENPKLGRKTAP